jgi:predicted peptidase
VSLFFLTTVVFSVNCFAADKLISYNIDASQVTISGVSSGAFMAHQMSVAYSKTISGIGSIAGGIYWCSQGSSQRAQTDCMKQADTLAPQFFIEKARELESSGDIDPLENLQRQRVYLFASPKDTVIKPPSSDKLYEFAMEFTPKENISYEKTHNFAHGFPTVDFGALCTIGFVPWLLKCNFDTAGEILKTMYPWIKKLPPAATKNEESKHLLLFDQSEFGNSQTPLYSTGWVYVPEKCASGEKCALHIALHGCQMTPDFIQDQFVKHAGYNSWADSNNIIVLYPQSAKIESSNPYACWDWYGFTGDKFMTKTGPQMKAIKSMIDRIVGSSK